jgi:ferredoxin-NADP reductase
MSMGWRVRHRFWSWLAVRPKIPSQDSAKLKVAKLWRQMLAAKTSKKYNSALGYVCAIESLLSMSRKAKSVMEAVLDSEENDDSQRDVNLLVEKLRLLQAAGYLEDASATALALNRILVGNPQVMILTIQCLLDARRHSEAITLAERLLHLASSIQNPEAANFFASRARQVLSDNAAPNCVSVGNRGAISEYSKWKVHSVSAVSMHTAIFSFRHVAGIKGEPQLRNRRGEMPWRRSWHVTLLVDVETNREGPLHFVERDYTPISSDQDWNNGVCDLVIKIYSNGLATCKLASIAVGTEMWVSQPKKTLRLPMFCEELPVGHRMSTPLAPVPAAVLWLVGGTGVAPALQAIRLAANEAFPIVCVYSCRQDDVLLWNELSAVMSERATRFHNDAHLPLLYFRMTPTIEATKDPPLAVLQSESVSKVYSNDSLEHWWRQVNSGRLSRQDIADVVRDLPRPLRVVISGPPQFNEEVRAMVCDCDFHTKWITTLEA